MVFPFPSGVVSSRGKASEAVLPRGKALDSCVRPGTVYDGTYPMGAWASLPVGGTVGGTAATPPEIRATLQQLNLVFPRPGQATNLMVLDSRFRGKDDRDAE